MRASYVPMFPMFPSYVQLRFHESRDALRLNRWKDRNISIEILSCIVACGMK